MNPELKQIEYLNQTGSEVALIDLESIEGHQKLDVITEEKDSDGNPIIIEMTRIVTYAGNIYDLEIPYNFAIEQYKIQKEGK